MERWKELKNLWILLCLFPFAELMGQTFAMNQYTVEDGLPSSFIYDITQDAEGFIWISSEGGLCRFDGNRFEKNPIASGLVAEVVELEVDSKGNLWLIDLVANIGCYDGRSYRLEQKGTSPYIQFVNYKEDKLGNNWFLSEDKIMVEIQNEEGKKPYQIFYERKDLQQCESMIVGADSSMYLISNFGIGHFKNYQLNYRAFAQPFKGLPTNGIVYENDLLFSQKNKLYCYDLEQDSLFTAFDAFQDQINSEIVHLFYHNHNLWIATRTEGLFFVKDAHLPNPKLNRLLEGIIVGSIHLDQHGGYWLGTEGNGLYYLPDLNTQIIPNKNDGTILTAVNTHPSGLIILGYDDGLFKIFDENYEVLKEEYLGNDEERIYEITSNPENKEIFLATKKLWKIDSSFQVQNIKKSSYLKAVRYGRDGKLWFGASSNAGCFEKDGTLKRLLNERTYAVEPTGENDAWLGTIRGLYHYSNGEIEFVKDSLLHQEIQDLHFAKDSTLWVATLTGGLFLYKNGKVTHHFHTGNGLVSNHCRKILLDDKFAWVATGLGVNQIDLRDFSSIFSIGKDEGLPSIEVNDIAKNKDQIFIATNKGLAIFADTSSFLELPVKLYLSSVRIQEKDTSIAEEYDLTYEQNNIKIEFTGIALRHAKELIYEYQMQGIDADWVSTRLGVAQYPSLPSGEYVFRVRARTQNAYWSEEKVLTFRISKAYWEEWWFYLGIVLIAAALGAVFVRAIIEDYQRRNEIQEKLKNSQLVALRARMNPHFLFNALNSIQELIIRNDKRSANRYLSQFSRLMRSTLNMSDKDEVALQSEIESLELYLSLEALRFEKDFEYQFDIASGLNTQEIKIPSLLIQPYVENAIIHGLMHRRGLKTLFISFKWQEPYLVAIVEDNGVGRKRAKEIQIRNGRPHPSTGMGLTKNRLDLLNSTHRDRLNVIVEDLKNKEGQATGTRVTLYIGLNEAFWERQNRKVDEIKKLSKH